MPPLLKVPVVCLIDELCEQNIMPFEGSVRHDSAAPLIVFDSRQPLRKRAYYQCLLIWDTLVKAGVKGFSSTASVAFFQLVLASKGLVDERLSAKECQARLAELRGERPSAELQRPVRAGDSQLPARRGALPGQPAPGAGADSASEASFACDPVQVESEDSFAADAEAHDCIVGDAGAVAGGELAAEAPGSAAEAAGVEAMPPAGGDMRAESAAPREVPAAGALQHPPEIGGMLACVVQGRYEGGYSYHRRLKLRCRNPRHENCSKTRSTKLLVEELGPRAAVLFLTAWQAASHLPEKAHKAYTPSMAEMRRCASQTP